MKFLKGRPVTLAAFFLPEYFSFLTFKSPPLLPGVTRQMVNNKVNRRK